MPIALWTLLSAVGYLINDTRGALYGLVIGLSLFIVMTIINKR